MSGLFKRLIGKAEDVVRKVIGKGSHSIKSVVGKLNAAQKFIEDNVPAPVQEAIVDAIDATPFGKPVRSVYKAARRLAKLAEGLPDDEGPPKVPAHLKVIRTRPAPNWLPGEYQEQPATGKKGGTKRKAPAFAQIEGSRRRKRVAY